MKKSISIASIFAAFIFIASNAMAGNNLGQCVYPKTKPAEKGRLVFAKPVYIHSSPNSPDKKELKDLDAFTIKAESNGFVQLETVPGISDQPAKIIGWAKLSDFRFQDLRNCN